MRGKNRSLGFFILTILIGFIIGTFLWDFAAVYFKAIKFLSYSQVIGIKEPVILDLNVMRVAFAFSLKINMGSVIGLILGGIIYRWL